MAPHVNQVIMVIFSRACSLCGVKRLVQIQLLFHTTVADKSVAVTVEGNNSLLTPERV